MSVKLYVRNLPYNVTQRELSELFSTKGRVFLATMLQSGWGLVEMDSWLGAKKAIDELNGQLWRGRELVVEYGRPESPSRARQGRRYTAAGQQSGYSSKPPLCVKCFCHEPRDPDCLCSCHNGGR